MRATALTPNSQVTQSDCGNSLAQATHCHRRDSQVTVTDLCSPRSSHKSLSQTVEIKPRDMFVSAVQKQKEIYGVEGEVSMCRDDVLAVFPKLSRDDVLCCL